MSESTKKWYVVRTAGGKEKKAKEYIEKEVEALHLGHLITQVLIPTEKYYQVKNGKRVSAERIFYPGYVLVEAVMTGEIQHMIRNIPYVAGFLPARMRRRSLRSSSAKPSRSLTARSTALTGRSMRFLPTRRRSRSSSRFSAARLFWS